MKSFKEYLVEAKEKEVQIKFSGPATKDVVDDFLSSAKENGLDIELEKADERGQFIYAIVKKGSISAIRKMPLVTGVVSL